MNKNKDAHVLSVSNRPDSISQSTIFLTLTWGNPHTQTRQLPAFLTLRMPLILIQPVHTLILFILYNSHSYISFYFKYKYFIISSFNILYFLINQYNPSFSFIIIISF